MTTEMTQRMNAGTRQDPLNTIRAVDPREKIAQDLAIADHRMDALNAEWKMWTEANGLPYMDAHELLMVFDVDTDQLTMNQCDDIWNWIDRYNQAEKAHTRAWEANRRLAKQLDNAGR